MTVSDQIIDHILKYAKTHGAEAADVMVAESQALSTAYRLGKQESLERSETTDIGIRVFIGKKQALVSSCDPKKETLEALTEQAIAMAKVVPEDPHCGLGSDYDTPMDQDSLDIFDPTPRDIDDLMADAAMAEEAALAVKGITNSEGADCTASQSLVSYATSTGFFGAVNASSHSVSVSVIAGRDDQMQRDYDYSHRRHLENLTDPAEIGRSAANRAVERLNPRKVKTRHLPVVYSPRVSSSLMGSLVSALSGGAIARGTSMLKNKMDQQICADHITIVDDPFLTQGLRSKPFDGEGMIPQKRNLIDQGRLTGWLLDLRSAHQLGLSSTGNAGRSASGTPSPRAHNLYMLPGELPPEDLIADIKEGLYITEMMGSSVSLLTGDYSRGAAGFWIENGKIAYPVSEITIAGNLADMWLQMTPANDLKFEHGINAPTIRIEKMMVAGD
jgi:PmbA protein